MKKEKVNKETGEISSHDLNEVLEIHTIRPDGSLHIQYDYQYCPTMTEQHTAHVTDINYLIERYKPNELAAYLVAKSQHRREILGHDFSLEPDSTQARNIAYNLRMAYENLDPEVKNHFPNHVAFLKFIDNPANAEKMIKLGLMTRREVQQNSTNDSNDKTKSSDLTPQSPDPSKS